MIVAVQDLSAPGNASCILCEAVLPDNGQRRRGTDCTTLTEGLSFEALVAHLEAIFGLYGGSSRSPHAGSVRPSLLAAAIALTAHSQLVSQALSAVVPPSIAAIAAPVIAPVIAPIITPVIPSLCPAATPLYLLMAAATLPSLRGPPG